MKAFLFGPDALSDTGSLGFRGLVGAAWRLTLITTLVGLTVYLGIGLSLKHWYLFDAGEICSRPPPPSSTATSRTGSVTSPIWSDVVRRTGGVNPTFAVPVYSQRCPRPGHRRRAGDCRLARGPAPRGAPSAFGLLVIAALTASPLIWVHYEVLLFVPIALLSPTLSPMWFLPVITGLVPVPNFHDHFQDVDVARDRGCPGRGPVSRTRGIARAGCREDHSRAARAGGRRRVCRLIQSGLPAAALDRAGERSRTMTTRSGESSRDPRVDHYIDALPPWQQDICRRLRDLIHAADAEITETIKRTVQPYFVLEGNVCALLAAKDHVNLFLYDGGIVPDPEGIITGGHDNKTARMISFHEGEQIRARPLTALLRQIAANNRAGGWRKLKAQG